MKKKIAIVVPVFNEEENLPILVQEIQSELTYLAEIITYELIFVDDGSTDTSWEAICDLTQTHPLISGIKLSRNFGHQAALCAGYDAAQADAVISMDADLQHPPHMLPKMIQAWLNGAQIVYVQNAARNDAFLKKYTAKWFYRFLHLITDISMPRNVADFRLIDASVLAIIKQTKEAHLYLRGLVAWTGFHATFLPCTFPKRLKGKSGYSWRKMGKLAVDGITGFSTFPLKLAGFLGIFTLLASFGLLSAISFKWYALSGPLSFNHLMFSFLLGVIGMQSMILWLMGEYIGRIYENTKERPRYIIDTKKGMAEMTMPLYSQIEKSY